MICCNIDLLTGDPLLRELATTVVSSRPAEAPAQPKRAKKDKSGTPPAPTSPLLEVLLHDTVLFPEGGGQPSDIGLLTSADGHVWEVAEVKRVGERAVHYVKISDKSIEDALNAFKTGEKVGAQLGEAGLQRRLDHVSHSSLVVRLLSFAYRPHSDVHAHFSALVVGRTRE